MMIERLMIKALKKGYAVAATPKTFLGFTLPFWLGTELQFFKRKMCYTPEALVAKWTRKRQMQAIKHRKLIFKELLKNDLHPPNPYF